MPSEFDALVDELRLGQAVASLPPEQRQSIEAMIGKPRDLAKASPMPRARPVAARQVPSPSRTEMPINPMEFDSLIREVATISGATSRAVDEARRSFIRDRARENARNTLAKALSAFHRGEITATQVSALEARAHRIFETADR